MLNVLQTSTKVIEGKMRGFCGGVTFAFCMFFLFFYQNEQKLLQTSIHFMKSVHYIILIYFAVFYFAVLAMQAMF